MTIIDTIHVNLLEFGFTKEDPDGHEIPYKNDWNMHFYELPTTVEHGFFIVYYDTRSEAGLFILEENESIFGWKLHNLTDGLKIIKKKDGINSLESISKLFKKMFLTYNKQPIEIDLKNKKNGYISYRGYLIEEPLF